MQRSKQTMQARHAYETIMQTITRNEHKHTMQTIKPHHAKTTNKPTKQCDQASLQTSYLTKHANNHCKRHMQTNKPTMQAHT